MGRASSIAKVIGINVAGLALALVGAEIALRIIKPEALQARLKMNESTRQEPAQAQGLFDFKEFRFKPDSQGQQFTQNTNIPFSMTVTGGETHALTLTTQQQVSSLVIALPMESGSATKIYCNAKQETSTQMKTFTHLEYPEQISSITSASSKLRST